MISFCLKGTGKGGSQETPSDFLNLMYGKFNRTNIT